MIPALQFTPVLRATMLATVIAWLSAGCHTDPNQADSAPAEQQRTFLTFGTVVEVDLYGVDQQRADAAFRALENYFAIINTDWYAYGDGELARVNQAISRGETITLSAPLATLTRRSLDLFRLSDGLFDPAIGRLVKLWKFHDSSADPADPPDAEAIIQWLSAHEGVDGLTLDGDRLSASSPFILDFGGIAKGSALAGAALLLRDNGIRNGIVNAGGDLVVLGTHGDRRWRVGIRDPREPKVLRTVELEPGESIVTSGDYERFFTYQGKRYHHLLDPRTGYPVTDTAAVTVIDDDPELADGSATALMVGGPSLFSELPARLGIRYALLITADGEVLMTPDMRQRLEEQGP